VTTRENKQYGTLKRNRINGISFISDDGPACTMTDEKMQCFTTPKNYRMYYSQIHTEGAAAVSRSHPAL